MKTNRLKAEIRHPKGLDITPEEVKNMLIAQASEVFAGLLTENDELYEIFQSKDEFEKHHIMMIEIKEKISVQAEYILLKLRGNWFQNLLIKLFWK